MANTKSFLILVSFPSTEKISSSSVISLTTARNSILIFPCLTSERNSGRIHGLMLEEYSFPLYNTVTLAPALTSSIAASTLEFCPDNCNIFIKVRMSLFKIMKYFWKVFSRYIHIVRIVIISRCDNAKEDKYVSFDVSTINWLFSVLLRIELSQTR